MCVSFHQAGKAKLFLVKVCSENVDKICIASLGNDSGYLIDTHAQQEKDRDRHLEDSAVAYQIHFLRYL